MTDYEEKLVIDRWYLDVINLPSKSGCRVALWVQLWNGLEYPVIMNPCASNVWHSADPTWGHDRGELDTPSGGVIELSDEFLPALGEVLEYMDTRTGFVDDPESWVDATPDKLSKLELWVIGQVVSMHLQGTVPYEIEVLCGKALSEKSQRDLTEFEEGEAA